MKIVLRTGASLPEVLYSGISLLIVLNSFHNKVKMCLNIILIMMVAASIFPISKTFSTTGIQN